MDLRSRVEFGSVERNETADRQAMTKTQSSSVDEGLWRGHIIDINRAFHVLEKLISGRESHLVWRVTGEPGGFEITLTVIYRKNWREVGSKFQNHLETLQHSCISGPKIVVTKRQES